MDKGFDRAKLQQEIMLRRRTGGYSGVVEPPFHLSGIEMMYFMGRLDPELIRSIIPSELTPAGTDWGTVAVYDVPHGWGIAPLTACIVGFEVEGYAPVDGQPAQYLHSGLYSGRAGETLRNVFNTNYNEGWCRQFVQGGMAIGEAGRGDQVLMRMTGEVTNAAYQSYSGTNRYIGRSLDGGLQLFSVAFTGEFTDVANAQVEFLPGAEDVMRAVKPLEYFWTVKLRNAAFTFSKPRKIGADQQQNAESDAFGIALMTLFAQSGRVAAIVRRDGRVLNVNINAQHLFTELPVALAEIENWLRPRLDPLLSQIDASGPDLVSSSVEVAFGEARKSLVMQAMALDEAVFGPGSFVVFLDDLSGGHDRHEVTPLLQLLGLSEAEARIAAAVGDGISPQQAAERLELSTNTVRSALKIIYDKLGISRQSELAKIVTRLAAQSIAT